RSPAVRASAASALPASLAFPRPAPQGRPWPAGPAAGCTASPVLRLLRWRQSPTRPPRSSSASSCTPIAARPRNLTSMLLLLRFVRYDINRAKTAMNHAIAVILHPGFQMLDVTGPVAAFEIANRFRPGSYALTVLAPEGGGKVPSSSGLGLDAAPLDDAEYDTILVSGGEIVRSMAAMQEIVGWLRQAEARRIA